MAMNNALRSCASKLLASTPPLLSKPANRGFHSTAATSMGGHGSHVPFYEHSKYMYNQDRMKHQALTMNLWVWGLFFGMGVAPPIVVFNFQQKKAKSA